MQLKTHWHLRMSLPCWFQNNNSNLYCTPGFHCQVTQSIILDHCWGISSKQLDQGIQHSNISFFMSWVMSQPAYQCRLNCVVSSFVSSFENVRLTNTSQVISLTSPVPAAMVPRDISTLPSTLPPGLLLQQPFILGPLFCPVLAKTVSQTVAAKYVDVSNLSANIIHTKLESHALLDGHLVFMLSTTNNCTWIKQAGRGHATTSKLSRGFSPWWTQQSIEQPAETI